MVCRTDRYWLEVALYDLEGRDVLLFALARLAAQRGDVDFVRRCWRGLVWI